MADTMTPEERSRCMAAIKGKDTKPESSHCYPEPEEQTDIAAEAEAEYGALPTN